MDMRPGTVCDTEPLNLGAGVVIGEMFFIRVSSNPGRSWKQDGYTTVYDWADLLRAGDPVLVTTGVAVPYSWEKRPGQVRIQRMKGGLKKKPAPAWALHTPAIVDNQPF